MNTDPLLLAWLGVSATGGAYTLLNLRSALRDRKAQRDTQRDGVLRTVTLANVRREAIRLVFWALAAAIGIAALFEAGNAWVGWALIGIMCLQAFNSWADRRERLEVGRHGG